MTCQDGTRSPIRDESTRVKIAILPGDGIGPEIVGEATKILHVLAREGVPIETETAPIGGAGYEAARHPLPHATLALAREADAVLLGAVGGPRYDALPRELRPEQGILAIRESKFHKTRFVPLSHDAQSELRAYLRLRLAPGPDHSSDSALLGHYTLSGKFIGYTGSGLGLLLRSILRTAQIRDPQGRRPRVHDFRHSFAVQALLRWYRDGADVQSQLPKLAMYMGHVSIVSTAHYLHWIPDVATSASRRFEAQWGKLMDGERS